MFGGAALAGLVLAGCATPPRSAPDRPFVFERDTLAFTNELAWAYESDAHGRWRGRSREPRPAYTLRCFPMARAVQQFFHHARFDPAQPPADEPTYARLVRQVLGRSPRTVSPPAQRVVLPGYAGLREFSAAREDLLKAACGGAAASYLQRGHWRMIFPFFKSQQAAQAERVVEQVRQGRPVVLHLMRFPQTGAINHAVVAFAVRETEEAWEFSLYDPNQPAAPVALRFDRTRRRFELERNAYYQGGPLHAYQVYHRWYY
jgi:hypothetical protein